MIYHDLHVHTTLSACCKDPACTAANILAKAAELGLAAVGFADHLWDPAAPGASDWYAPQDVRHVLQIRDRIPADASGVRALVGCESEYVGGGVVGITRAAAEQFDFVLLPFSHFHMTGYVVPKTLSRPRDVAALMCERFAEVIELGLATGIAHPFMPCGFGEQTDAILACIPDAQFADGFGRAAELGVSMEITAGFFPRHCLGGDQPWADEAFLRMLRLAREAGCTFHLASDAHSLDRFGSVLRLGPYLEQAGITEEHFAPVARGEGR